MTIRIGELAKRTACQEATIRFYEREGLLPAPARSEGNYRIYGEEHVDRLQFIRHCRSLDMSLDEVRTLLQYRATPSQDCGEITSLVEARIQQVEARVQELLALKRQLETLRYACAGARPAEACGILQGLSQGSATPPHRGATPER